MSAALAGVRQANEGRGSNRGPRNFVTPPPQPPQRP